MFDLSRSTMRKLIRDKRPLEEERRQLKHGISFRISGAVGSASHGNLGPLRRKEVTMTLEVLIVLMAIPSTVVAITVLHLSLIHI